jgi:hypothetical protein
VALRIRKLPQAAELWDLIQMQGRLFGLMAGGKKESSQMDHKIGGVAVAGVLNLGNVLELVDDGLGDGSFARQELVAQVHQAAGHVLTQPRDEVESLLKKQLGERSGDVASVANEFAAQSLDQERNRTAIIHISWSQATGQQLSLVIDRQMEFEAKEPAHSRHAASGLSCKDPVLTDAFGMTNFSRGGVDETDAGARSVTSWTDRPASVQASAG